METLEVLEARLADYQGTLIVVSHDRQFLDNVVTSTIVFEENGHLQEYVGGYSDWIRQGHALTEVDRENADRISKQLTATESEVAPVRKLSYREQRELDGLPKKIEALETEIELIQSQIAANDFYAQDRSKTAPILDKLADIQRRLDKNLERWSALEDQVRLYQESRK